MSTLVTLTTDFEERDPYVATLKGALYSGCPSVQAIDLSHVIPRNSILEASLFIAGVIPHFPKGTIHLVCVSSGPTPIAISIDGQIVLCPDNGVITVFAEQNTIEDVRAIAIPEVDSSMGGQIYFGRDVFAPAAAALASGGDLADLGESIEDIKKLNIPAPRREGVGSIIGQIIHIDHFGNLVTNIDGFSLDGVRVSNVEVAGFPIGPISEGFRQVEVGSPLALFGSAGYLEIAYNGDRADKRLNALIGNNVTLTLGR